MISNGSMTFGRRVIAPRGARWAAQIFLALAEAPRALAAHSLRGAVGGLQAWDRRLQARATRTGRSDVVAGLGRDPRSEAEVLALASRVERTDPGFASDLRAAVWRHSDQAV